jgi:predicted TIM-barrel fold metal-dependent hydrolase
MTHRVIDSHHHWLPLELVDHLEQFVTEGLRVSRQSGLCTVRDDHGNEVLSLDVANFCDVGLHLRGMDAAGIDLALLSVGRAAGCLSLAGACLVNDAYADLVALSGGRFEGIAFVPPLGDGTIEELERASALGLRGVCVTGSRNGVYLDDAPCLSFLRQAAELDLPVVVHPGRDPRRLPSTNVPYPIEDAPVLDMHLLTLRLLRNTALRDDTQLRLLIPHLGGSFYVGGTWRHSSQPPEPLSAWSAGRVLFDTGPSFGNGPQHLALALRTLGIEYLALGSDFPIMPDPETLADAVRHIQSLGLPIADGDRVLGGNAATFFRL